MQPGESYQFGPFVLDTGRMSLARDDRELELRPKAYQTLLVLVRNAGRVVSKDELVAAVWPNVVVNDDALAQCVRDVRKAIADNGHHYIRTLSRRGYMFNQPVLPRVRVRRAVFGSVAALPFETGSPGDGYLAEGVAETLVNGLVRLRHLRVAPKASVRADARPGTSPRDIGCELGVEAILTGRVTTSGERVRVEIDLSDVEYDAHIGSFASDGRLSELQSIQDRILIDVAEALGAAARPGAELRLLSSHPDAYRAYLQGRHQWNHRSDFAGAVACFRRAIDLDAEFAAAHSALADCFVTMGKASHLPPAEAFAAARLHAGRAVELDQSMAEPFASLGFVRLYYDWDWPGAEAQFRRAIGIDPGYAISHEWFSVFLLIAGRQSEAIAEIDLAHRLDRLSMAIHSTRGFHYYYEQRYEDAVRYFQFVLSLTPDFSPSHLWLGRTSQELGRFDDANEQYRGVAERAPDWCVAIAARGCAAGEAGYRAEAIGALRELEALAQRAFVSPYSVAVVHAGLGDHESALAWLERAFEERSNWLVWLRLDPRWSTMRADPRFEALVRRMGFPTGSAGLKRGSLE
jgi:DNA-binding winged helix-turn-helix (wHTH) protein/tetratricopeptide (TPR) repeat protein